MSKKGLFWGIAVAVIVLDRVTKVLAPGLPADGVVLIPGVIGLRYAENRGIAFSLLSGHPRLLGILSLLLIAAGYVWLRKKDFGIFPMVGLALMAGGAAGNMADRLITGYVPDMIETLFVRFPIFNLADSCLTIGCVDRLCDADHQPVVPAEGLGEPLTTASGGFFVRGEVRRNKRSPRCGDASIEPAVRRGVVMV